MTCNRNCASHGATSARARTYASSRSGRDLGGLNDTCNLLDKSNGRAPGHSRLFGYLGSLGTGDGGGITTVEGYRLPARASLNTKKTRAAAAELWTMRAYIDFDWAINAPQDGAHAPMRRTQIPVSQSRQSVRPSVHSVRRSKAQPVRMRRRCAHNNRNGDNRKRRATLSRCSRSVATRDPHGRTHNSADADERWNPSSARNSAPG